MAEHLANIFGTEKDKVNCPFYFKIGACRHGERCSRLHNKPAVSPTLLLHHMYPNPVAMSHVPIPEDSLQEHFLNFYEDIFEELKNYGTIEELCVVDNVCDHMIGNVYVKFDTEDEAQAAFNALQGRFYAERPIVCEYSPVTDFQEASCRQYEMGECMRGGLCNFMHLKVVPRDLYRDLFGHSKPEYRRDDRRRRGGRDDHHRRDHHRRDYRRDDYHDRGHRHHRDDYHDRGRRHHDDDYRHHDRGRRYRDDYREDDRDYYRDERRHSRRRSRSPRRERDYDDGRRERDYDDGRRERDYDDDRRERDYDDDQRERKRHRRDGSMDRSREGNLEDGREHSPPPRPSSPAANEGVQQGGGASESDASGSSGGAPGDAPPSELPPALPTGTLDTNAGGSGGEGETKTVDGTD